MLHEPDENTCPILSLPNNNNRNPIKTSPSSSTSFCIIMFNYWKKTTTKLYSLRDTGYYRRSGKIRQHRSPFPRRNEIRETFLLHFPRHRGLDSVIDYGPMHLTEEIFRCNCFTLLACAGRLRPLYRKMKSSRTATRSPRITSPATPTQRGAFIYNNALYCAWVYCTVTQVVDDNVVQ